MNESNVDVPTIITHIRKNEKRFSIFKGITDEELRAILWQAMSVYRPPGKVLFRKGQPAREIFVILQGQVDIIDHLAGRSKIINQLTEGELFGEVALFLGHERTATAKTKTAALLLVLDEHTFVKIMRSSGGPRFALNLMRVLSHRLDAMTHKYMKAKYAEKHEHGPKSWLD